MQLPSEADIRALLDQYHTPDHIRRHMQVVAKIAERIAVAQRDELDKPVDVPAVVAAALLHDLVRIPEQWPHVSSDIHTPAPHAEVNYLILRESYPDIANIIREHSLMTILQPNTLTTLEQQIVYYADKRVNHDQPVSLAERIQLGQERWQVDPNTNQTDVLLPALHALEKALFAGTTLTPESVTQHITQ